MSQSSNAVFRDGLEEFLRRPSIKLIIKTTMTLTPTNNEVKLRRQLAKLTSRGH